MKSSARVHCERAAASAVRQRRRSSARRDSGRRAVEVKPSDRQLRRVDDARGVVVREPAELASAPIARRTARQASRPRDRSRCSRRLGRPKTMPNAAADQAGQQRDRPSSGRPWDAQVEIVGGERADRHERRRAERELAGIAGQQVQPERRERRAPGTAAGSPRTDSSSRSPESNAGERRRPPDRPATAARARRCGGDESSTWSCASDPLDGFGRTGRRAGPAGTPARRHRRTSSRCRRRRTAPI